MERQKLLFSLEHLFDINPLRNFELLFNNLDSRHLISKPHPQGGRRPYHPASLLRAPTVYTGDVTTAAASTITIDAASKWVCTKDGVVLSLNGRSIPLVDLIGTAHFTSTAATGATIAAINQSTTATDTTDFTAGLLWTCTSCDTAGMNGAVGQYQIYKSASAGVQDSLALTADLSFSRTKWKDTHSKNRMYINNGTNVNLGNLK